MIYRSRTIVLYVCGIGQIHRVSCDNFPAFDLAIKTITSVTNSHGNVKNGGCCDTQVEYIYRHLFTSISNSINYFTYLVGHALPYAQACFNLYIINNTVSKRSILHYFCINPVIYLDEKLR